MNATDAVVFPQFACVNTPVVNLTLTVLILNHILHTIPLLTSSYPYNESNWDMEVHERGENEDVTIAKDNGQFGLAMLL